MKAQSTDKKTFVLTDDGQSLGELIYENMFFLNAEIKLENNEVFKIKPVGLFQTSITVTKNEKEIANLKMNWRGQIVIAFTDGQEFVFAPKGMFHNKYTIENKDGEIIIQFEPKFNWSIFHYNYEIAYDQKPQDALFILLGLYASNYFIASMSGIISAGTA